MRRLAWLLVLASCGRPTVEVDGLTLSLDQEEREHGAPLSGSTQSVNRYHSVLQNRHAIDFRYDGARLAVTLRGDGNVRLANIDPRFVVPVRNYAHGKKLDAFDKLVLMLAEYSRSGVELAVADKNDAFGYAAAAQGVFDDSDEEYHFIDGGVEPNGLARPKRMQLVNNCLFPGLWELAASDSVGEMWHGWFKLPEKHYFALYRAVDNAEATDEELHKALDYQKQIPEVALELDRLRSVDKALGEVPAQLITDKPIDSYSTQDSRRKVQRRFYTVERGGVALQPAPKTVAELKPGDVFAFHSFVPPGIYTKKEPRRVAWDPVWVKAQLALVTPKTQFAAPSPHKYSEGALELTLWSADGKRAIVVGNLPVDLLVPQEDFDIPGFGVGVLRASEPVERRWLYMKDGPAPVYAFSAHKASDGRLNLTNNHEEGLEQVYLRTLLRPDGTVGLRVTLVAYERIVDLVEVELTLPPELADRVRHAAAAYQRPLWRSFSDSNLL
jgi:hypothetical protein